MEVEPLPPNWDGAGSSVHRGGARMWGDASHAGGVSFVSPFRSGSYKGGSRSGRHGSRRGASANGSVPKHDDVIDVEAAATR